MYKDVIFITMVLRNKANNTHNYSMMYGLCNLHGCILDTLQFKFSDDYTASLPSLWKNVPQSAVLSAYAYIHSESGILSQVHSTCIPIHVHSI